MPFALLAIACIPVAIDNAPRGKDTSADSAPEPPPVDSETDSGGDTGRDSGPDPSAERPSGTPNAGTLDWAVSVDLDIHHDIRAVADLDGDGRDEIILDDSPGGVLVASIDLDAGTVDLGAVSGLPAEVDEILALSEGRLYIEVDDDESVVSLAKAGGGTWAVASQAAFEKIEGAAPVGDLDGDGADDVLVVPSYGYEVRVYAGPPTASDGRVLLTVTSGRQELASEGEPSVGGGDLDGDGQDDLLIAFDGGGRDREILIAYGPIDGVETSSWDSMAQSRVEAPDDATPCVLWDIDDNGARELLAGNGMLYEAAAPGSRELVLTSRLPGVGSEYRVGALPVATGVEDDLASWWYPPARTGDTYLAPATIPLDTIQYAFARLGSSVPIDLVAVDDYVRAVPGWGATPGSDVDRDGTPAPEDCDDTDPELRPTALDVPDGTDNDCDGDVDEWGGAPMVEIASWSATDHDSQRSDASAVAFDDGWVAVARAGEDDGSVLYDPATGTAMAFGGNPSFGRAGDFDGDGQSDLTLGEIGLSFGPGTSHEDVSWSDYGFGGTTGALYALGDVDGDGDTELWGEAWIHEVDVIRGFEGLVPGNPSRSDWPEVLDWPAAQPQEGADLDGDGHGDLVLDDGSLLPGPLDLDALPTLPAAAGSVTRSDGDFYYFHLINVDLDGDGAIDLLSPRPDGGIDVAHGPFTWSAIDLATTSRVLVPDGLFDADPEDIVADPGLAFYVADRTADRGAGRVFAFDTVEAPASLDDALWAASGLAPGDAFGTAMTALDLDGDGLDELVVTSPAASPVLYGEGRIQTFRAP